MPRGPDAAKLELWRRRLRDFERGAETVAAFCQRTGVSAATFYVWRRRVAELAAEANGPKSPGRSTPKSGESLASLLSFLPVQVTGQSPSMIEVVLTNGTRVLIPSSDRQSLRWVLEFTAGVTEQPSC